MAKLECGEHTHMTSDGDAFVGGLSIPAWLVITFHRRRSKFAAAESAVARAASFLRPCDRVPPVPEAAASAGV
jgi:hypothetical protein